MDNLVIKLYDKWGKLKDERRVVNAKTFTFSNLLVHFLTGIGGNVFADRIAYGDNNTPSTPFDTALANIISGSVISVESFSSSLGGYLPVSGLFTADDGSVSSIIDTTEPELSSENGAYAYWLLIIKAGTNANEWRRVGRYDGTPVKQFVFANDFINPCDNTTQYKIFDPGTWHIHVEWAAGVGTCSTIYEFGHWLNGYTNNYLLARAVLESPINKTVDDRLIADWHGRIW